MNRYGEFPHARSAYSGRFPRTLAEIGWGHGPLLPMPGPNWLIRLIAVIAGH